MNIHEYQAKELLQKFDVATTRGRVATTLDEAEQIARELGDIDIVVKAQIHAGGRGKGSFKNGFKGGVHVRKTPDEVRDVAAKMLGQILVTHQTGAAGRRGEQSSRGRIGRYCAGNLFCRPARSRDRCAFNCRQHGRRRRN